MSSRQEATMFDWLNPSLGTLGELGVPITVCVWLGNRQTNAILQEQSRILG
jgi:hypothetical protein